MYTGMMYKAGPLRHARGGGGHCGGSYRVEAVLIMINAIGCESSPDALYR